MSGLNLPFGILVLWCASGIYSETTTVKYTYNSSDISYLSNGIQFPVADSEVLSLKVDNMTEDMSQFQWFSQLYDHNNWWPNLEKLTVSKCKDDMITYLKELKNGTWWALKMYDASGKYSGQFFFGNDYWLGSQTFCEELSNQETNVVVPPFPVNFYVSKIRINLNRQATPVTRQLNVGECLPKSCGVNGVREILAHERNQGASVNIVGVRKVPGDYNVLEDIKFQIVGGSCLVVLLIIAIASITELLISRTKRTDKVDAELDNNNTSPNQNHNGISQVFGSTNTVLKSDRKEQKRSKTDTPRRLLLAFSAISNGKKILSVDNVSNESIKCIHGLRFFSIAWIILVHSYLEIFAVADNKYMRILTERGFMYQTISNATFSVDTFFFISGLLVTLTYFRSDAKKKKPENESIFKILGSITSKFILMVAYRIMRLTPAYLFVLGINEIIMRFLHSNSVFSPAIIDHISCTKFWWRNALYINNFYPQHQFCMLWSWYIANDTQFYVIASFLLILAVRGPSYVKFAAVTIGGLLLTSWITTFIIAMKWDYVARVEEPFALFDQLYDKPWLRIGPYLIGIISGYGLFRVNCKMSMSAFIVISGWMLSLTCLACLVYGLGREGLVVPASAFYAALGHTAWGLSLAWITIACCTGYGGPLNALFSFNLFLPLSRLTYCAYLIHPVLMCLTSFYMDGSLHLHNSMAIVIYFGNLVLSFVSAFAISLVFEAPVVNILKILF